MNTLRRTARTAVEKATKVADAQFRKNISLSCHSQKDLAALDHPYAARHGATGRPIHSPYWLVHRQTGGLLSQVRDILVIETAGSVVGNFGFEIADLPLWIVTGTSKMIPRPVVAGSLTQVKDQVMATIVQTFKSRYGERIGVS